ncbi:Cob(I)yrinic acid a,c-diamide adenosyltransferase [Candidatus Johnevansia muelleri]|uniref:Corrinoid adenosyltransferase n=1 Tax=Candidatus Johnevansia muelleri TaxID=1495769 RepID=A0A078KHQ7_9GAMM|nr:Cob(I)yrinic acid a,c-diamide adenosyltransferase [Candidatus Evansia muelleri]
MENFINIRHKKSMHKLKKHIDAKINFSTIDRGLILSFTGNGKGKTTAAWGTVTRALGYGYNVGIVQFIKGSLECGEYKKLKNDTQLEVKTMSTNFTWETQNYDADRYACEFTWNYAKNMLINSSIYLLVLDEISYMIKFGYLNVNNVKTAIINRPPEQSVIITGRNIHSKLLEISDIITDMHEIRHAFNNRLKARKGIDY